MICSTDCFFFSLRFSRMQCKLRYVEVHVWKWFHCYWWIQKSITWKITFDSTDALTRIHSRHRKEEKTCLFLYRKNITPMFYFNYFTAHSACDASFIGSVYDCCAFFIKKLPIVLNTLFGRLISTMES